MLNIKIPNFNNAKVLVVGDVILDQYWRGEASRISPEAPVPVVLVQNKQFCPGGAGNVALNISALGAQVSLLGIVGDDDNGKILQNYLLASNVNCDLLLSKSCATITKTRILSQHQQLIRLDEENKFTQEDAKLLFAKFKKIFANFDVIILSDYNKGSLQNSEDFIKTANTKNIKILVDPKSADFSIYSGATLITPNYKEFIAAAGFCQTEKDIIKKARCLIDKYKIKNILITRGEHGMTLIEQNKDEVYIPAHAQQVYDVTGAGDTVIATVAATLAAGESLLNATMLANIAASITISKLGAATVSVAELRRALQKNILGCLLNEEQLILAIKDAHAHKEKVVMTNGCFDILHAGHVHYLEQAKKLGDRLIIAVNDDNSVRRLKGKNRPINNLEKRITVLSALSSVDWIIPFSEDTPERLICNLLPDILVKGGDYKVAEIAGAKCVLENGGQVKILDFIADNSTTSVIKKIKNE